VNLFNPSKPHKQIARRIHKNSVRTSQRTPCAYIRKKGGSLMDFYCMESFVQFVARLPLIYISCVSVYINKYIYIYIRTYVKGKGKVVPLQVRCGPEGSRRFRLPDFHDIRHLKAVTSSASCTGRLYPQECSWYSFSLGAESTPGPW
jgi:hypothetical protein